MHRRQFLAVIGAAVAAGCAGETASTDERSSTTAPPPTPTARSTTDEPATERTVERSTEGPARTSTRGAELLDRGRTHLEAAIEEFTDAAAGSDPTIVDVNAATVEFSRFDVHDEYVSAERHLTDAKNHTDGDDTRLANDLLEVAEFVDALGFAQIHLVNSYKALERALRSFYTESYGELPGDVDDLVRQRRAAADYAQTIREDYDETTVEPVDSITGEQFLAKVEQMDRELAAFDVVATQLDGLDAVMERFEANVRDYTSRRYGEVSFVATDFREARDGLEAIEPPVSLGPVIEELVCVFGALAGGTTEMRNAVLDRRDDDSATAREYERAAEAEFESCERLATEVRPVTNLVDSLPQ